MKHSKHVPGGFGVWGQEGGNLHWQELAVTPSNRSGVCTQRLAGNFRESQASLLQGLI